MPFDQPMKPQGNVEIWLGEVERRMRNSVRYQIQESMKAYTSVARTQWVRDWPAMVVLAVSAIFWSAEVEEAITGKTHNIPTFNAAHCYSFGMNSVGVRFVESVSRQSSQLSDDSDSSCDYHVLLFSCSSLYVHCEEKENEGILCTGQGRPPRVKAWEGPLE